MADYHRYIFDFENRRIIGDFDGAYSNCDDTWPSQHDVHLLKYQSVIQLARTRGPNTRVADIGAGYGDFVAALRQEGVDATGFEVSAAAVERGRSRFGLAEHLAIGDITRGISVPDGTFDIVTTFGVLWYILDRLHEALAEMRRITAPGGSVIVSLTMFSDPIGKEIISSYDDLLAHLRRWFRVSDAIVSYFQEDLAANKPLADCRTEIIAYCHVD